MDKLFLFQLVTSFIVGGGLIALLSLIAERSSQRTAGIVLSFPSTMGMGIFFVGWTLGKEIIPEIVPIIIVLIGVVMIFSIIYLYLSKIHLSKPLSILLCMGSGLLFWLLSSTLLVTHQFTNLPAAVAIYAALTLTGYYFITAKPHITQKHQIIRYTLNQKIWRATLAGTVVATAVFLSKTLDPLWGGIFSGFPAVFSTSLFIYHKQYDSAFLFKILKNAPIGSLPMMIFGVTAFYSFPAFGLFLGLVASYLASTVTFAILIHFHQPE